MRANLFLLITRKINAISIPFRAEFQKIYANLKGILTDAPVPYHMRKSRRLIASGRRPVPIPGAA